MKLNSVISRIFLLILLLISFQSFSDSPPANTIPVIGLKANYEDIDTEFFCFLSWHNFDGLSRQFYNAEDILENVVLPGDTTGMITVVNPWKITCMTNWFSHMFPMDSTLAFARPVWKGYTSGGVTYTEDALIDSLTAIECRSEMQDIAAEMDTLFNQNSHSVWFYYGFDEAPAFQWSRMVRDSVDHVFSEYDDYMPNLFTQAMDSVYRPDLGLASDSAWQPTLEEVDPSGVLSWMNWHIHQADSTREIGYIISTMHTLDDWAGATNINEGYNFTPPNFHNQAQAVRALFSMQYQRYDSTSAPLPEDNYPSFLAQDAYPFRHVGTAYQNSASYTPQLGTTLENWLLDHYEVGMDSTFITAWNIATEDTLDISMFFVPQSFGRTGGTGMWDTLSVAPFTSFLSYESYIYRIPAPQEFRMTCNSSLIRQSKALLPYCLTSYTSSDGKHNDVGLLDRNNIPFNAPYEKWVYRDRQRSDLDFIPPDSLPPFIDGYDPLYDLPSRPDTIAGSDRNTENYLLWKFAAYGRLWNSVKVTFGQIARVAPELAPLTWWQDKENNADIDYDAQLIPTLFRSPQIKVFTDSTESDCYLFYLNRYCRADGSPFEIVVDANDFPRPTPFGEYALDHNRRFLIEGDETGINEYTFLDTLDAGEARLIQMFDETKGLDADIRITDPDLRVVLPANGDTLTDYRSVRGDQVDILARFYNMGTGSLNRVQVYLHDDTEGVTLDTAEVSFTGLNTDSCWKADSDDAILSWDTDSASIGVHRLRVYTEMIIGEPDHEDNSATLVCILDPADYATEVLDDPWDMTEATGLNPPAWHTDDISATGGEWITAGFTDSISGMFEGVLSTSISGPLLRGDISLAVKGNSPIDTDTYKNLSFAAVCMNPNVTTQAGCELHLWWIDSQGDTLTADISNEVEIGAIQNGSDQWREYGPLDLSGVSGLDWNTEEAEELWLSFRTGKPAAPIIPQPVDIRLGWVKLTE